MSNYDPLDLKAQDKVHADKASANRLAQQNEESDVEWLMSDKRGRRVCWRLMDQAGVYRTSFNSNAMQMAFAEGNRNYGLRILSMIHTVCPKMYSVMMKEQNDRNPNNSE